MRRAVVGLLLVAVTAAGCTTRGEAVPAETLDVLCPTPCPAKPASTYVACIQANGAIPLDIVRRARQKVAARVGSAVMGPMGRTSFDVRIVDGRAYEPTRHVLGLDLAEVPAPPAPPELPQSAYDTDRRNRLIREYNTGPAVHWRAQLRERRNEARTAAAKVMAVPLTGWNSGPANVIGCVYRAAAAYPRDNSYRLLYILSDLTVSADQLQGTLRLNGVTVEVDYYCDADVRVCDNRKRAFRTLLLKDGHAHRVHFNDPQNLKRG